MSAKITGPDEKPPVGGMGGSIHDWRRGTDPFHESAFPDHLKEHAPHKGGEPKPGWFAVDGADNDIAFVPDGTEYRMEGGIMVTWDRTKLKRFKAAYAACREDRFMFDGHEFVKAYAKYLIEYLEMSLRLRRRPS